MKFPRWLNWGYEWRSTVMRVIPSQIVFQEASSSVHFPYSFGTYIFFPSLPTQQRPHSSSEVSFTTAIQCGFWHDLSFQVYNEHFELDLIHDVRAWNSLLCKLIHVKTENKNKQQAPRPESASNLHRPSDLTQRKASKYLKCARIRILPARIQSLPTNTWIMH
jgi:hypothetical protein